MDFESIIGFIFFIAITTLFNKDKKQTKNRRQQQTNQNSTVRDTINKPKTVTSTKSTTAPTRRQQSFGQNKLEDFLNEMQKDIRQVFGELQSTVEKTTVGKKPIEAEVVTEAPAVVQNDTNGWDYDGYFGMMEEPTVEEKEPIVASDTSILEVGVSKKEEKVTAGSRLSFNRSSMVQAIIMSEILDKPKSLRR